MKIDWDKIERKLKPPKQFWRVVRKIRDKLLERLATHQINWAIKDIKTDAWVMVKGELRQYIEVDVWNELPWYYRIIKPIILAKMYKYLDDAGIVL